jgi:hypothetical protein
MLITCGATKHQPFRTLSQHLLGDITPIPADLLLPATGGTEIMSCAVLRNSVTTLWAAPRVSSFFFSLSLFSFLARLCGWGGDHFDGAGWIVMRRIDKEMDQR